uniref:Uncharacterized protein n=1 Tax=Meloidogyne enterolobii TaxID=390850 RepID=A0A6V7URK2_MELEN|nr:unnamed protein product [Meloidogyne enterolobii]
MTTASDTSDKQRKSRLEEVEVQLPSMEEYELNHKIQKLLKAFAKKNCCFPILPSNFPNLLHNLPDGCQWLLDSSKEEQ